MYKNVNKGSNNHATEAPKNDQHKHKRSPSNVSRENDKRWWQKILSNKSLKCPRWKKKVAKKNIQRSSSIMPK